MACRREFLGFPVIYFYDINSTSSDRRIYTHPRVAGLDIFAPASLASLGYCLGCNLLLSCHLG